MMVRLGLGSVYFRLQLVLLIRSPGFSVLVVEDCAAAEPWPGLAEAAPVVVVSVWVEAAAPGGRPVPLVPGAVPGVGVFAVAVMVPAVGVVPVIGVVPAIGVAEPVVPAAGFPAAGCSGAVFVVGRSFVCVLPVMCTTGVEGRDTGESLPARNEAGVPSAGLSITRSPTCSTVIFVLPSSPPPPPQALSASVERPRARVWARCVFFMMDGQRGECPPGKLRGRAGGRQKGAKRNSRKGTGWCGVHSRPCRQVFSGRRR